MLMLDEAETRNALPFAGLIDALDLMFRSNPETPKRHHHAMNVPGEAEATLLLMPAWVPGRYFGVKMVSVFPDNSKRGLPAIFGSYLLSSGTTGELLAILDGGELTARRTAAASALASRYLSRKDSSTMLVVGTGRLSVNLIEAHAAVRPISQVLVWGRDKAKAQAVRDGVAPLGLSVSIADDLEAAARRADIISCCTLSEQPLIEGAWLKPGTHLDLIGAFKPTMRECDDEAVRRSRIYVDTRAGALAEGGDIIQPIRAGVISSDDIVAELAELAAGAANGRGSGSDITLFKSVGASLEDLAGAIFALEQIGRKASEEI
ncbi:ornithine cyclodeaminase family protein [Rhizobium sp. KVB221]|uniref:Ornithine cyclodeaminase family protein n=1 Tax=Rhizobium setariae TaxID=2801340 RepID=A0A937CRA6_9HYPH|nr:ornithine cyclodeaminase family protein [Rhizobium setariae]MBL0374212.1 ornithine cyclodeaminase family protein [Rhizobium setariae]